MVVADKLHGLMRIWTVPHDIINTLSQVKSLLSHIIQFICRLEVFLNAYNFSTLFSALNVWKRELLKSDVTWSNAGGNDMWMHVWALIHTSVKCKSTVDSKSTTKTESVLRLYGRKMQANGTHFQTNRMHSTNTV